MSSIKCSTTLTSDFKLSSELEKQLSLLASAYNTSLEKIACSLTTPVLKYYLRVNKIRTTVNQILESLRQQGLEVFHDGKIEEAIYFLRKGPFEIEDTGKYVIADKHAADRVMLGANLYVPGILKIIKAQKNDYVTIITKEGTMVANGILKISSRDLGKIRKGIGVQTTKSIYEFPKIRELKEYKKGLVTDQSYPSMSLMHAIQPSERETIIDITASPGGKITHAYEHTSGKATTIAIDHTTKKIKRIIEQAERLGHNITVIKTDSRYLHKDYPEIKPKVTIVDPPCTGLGNRPRLTLNTRLDDLKNLLHLQKQLLAEAIKITRPGGIISYSTCTLTTWENEEIIEWVLKEYPVKPLEPYIPLPLSPLTDYPMIRYTPGIHDAPGFFIALLQRI